MNKKLQLKDSEKKSANVQRSSSYRLALRRSAPPETEDLLTKNSEKSEERVVTSQPSSEKKDIIKTESTDVQIEPLITDQKTEPLNGFNSNGYVEENRTEGQNDCTKFCCHRLCCTYCKCCPNWCSLRMKRLETLLIHCTECGLNCLRVFT